MKRWQDMVNILAALWLFMSPWALGTTDDPFSSWNAWIVSLVLFGILFWAAIVEELRAPEWVTALIGLWLLCSPWILHYSTPSASMATWITGGLITILAVWGALWQSPTMHHLTH